jgi:hypothetical protein
VSTSECPSPETSNTFSGSNFIRVDTARDYLNEMSGREIFFYKTQMKGAGMTMMSCRKKRRKTPRAEKHGERVGRSALILNTDLEVKAWPLRLGKPTDVQDAHSINIRGPKSIQFFFQISSLDSNTETHTDADEQNERQLDHRRLGTGMSEMSVSLHK